MSKEVPFYKPKRAEADRHIRGELMSSYNAKEARRFQQPSHEEVMEVFIKHLCTFYFQDFLSPSVVTSWLPNENVWYASIARFPRRRPHQRVVILAVTSNRSRMGAEAKLIRAWKRCFMPHGNIANWMSEFVNDAPDWHI